MGWDGTCLPCTGGRSTALTTTNYKPGQDRTGQGRAKGRNKAYEMRIPALCNGNAMQ